MPSPIDDRRPPITPQLAVRVAVLGGFAFVLFAVIFFRLWFLQVLTGDDYVVLVRSSFAGYLADWLLDAALEFTTPDR